MTSEPTSTSTQTESELETQVEPTIDLDPSTQLDLCRFAYLTGPAGSGKTHLLKRKVEDSLHSTENTRKRLWGQLCATTGIAGVNLGTSTLNSIIGYFDTNSLMEIYSAPYNNLVQRLARVANKYERLCIDEVSMMDADQLDLIFAATQQLNELGYSEGKELGIILTGDFMQLSPVKAHYAFEGSSWGAFEENTIKLTHIWRQDDKKFLDALQLLRAGDGPGGARALAEAGVEFTNQLDLNFDGCTVVGKNNQVDRINQTRFMKLPGQSFSLQNLRWGRQRSEWDKLIPVILELKPGALVMILANDPDFIYANGDLGVVCDDPMSEFNLTMAIKLKRNGMEVEVNPIERHFKTKNKEDQGLPHFNCNKYCSEYDDNSLPAAPWGKSSYDCRDGSVVTGAIRYWPVRLAYSSTTHKTQGLTLDRVQVDVRDAFMGEPMMCYVALSRARTAQGIRVIGNEQLLGKRIRIDEKVRRFL